MRDDNGGPEEDGPTAEERTFEAADLEIADFDLSKSFRNPFAERSKAGYSIVVRGQGRGRPTYRAFARRQGRQWWLEFPDLPIERLRVARWKMTERAFAAISAALDVDPSSFDLHVTVPPLRGESEGASWHRG